MDFTREPIIETIITPKEGYKLVVKRSKSDTQEDYLVDALEIVSFNGALFFRSLERPKAFLLPVTDYEVLEVRETRMVLKTPGVDRSIKIGGGRDAYPKQPRETEKVEESKEEQKLDETSSTSNKTTDEETSTEVKVEKKKDKRRQSRRRRGRDEPQKEVEDESASAAENGKTDLKEPVAPLTEDTLVELPVPALSPAAFSALLQPPTTLISETINRYRQNEAFKGAFYLTEEEQYKPHEKVQEILDEEEFFVSTKSENDVEKENFLIEDSFEQSIQKRAMDEVLAEDELSAGAPSSELEEDKAALSLFEEEPGLDDEFPVQEVEFGREENKEPFVLIEESIEGIPSEKPVELIFPEEKSDFLEPLTPEASSDTKEV